MHILHSWGRTLALTGFMLGGLALAPDAFAQQAAAESPWSVGLVASMAALSVGGVSAVLGMWVGRDSGRPILTALAMTALIGIAVGVGVIQSYLDAVDGVAKRADLVRMHKMVEEIAANTGDDELIALIRGEEG